MSLTALAISTSALALLGHAGHGRQLAWRHWRRIGSRSAGLVLGVGTGVDFEILGSIQVREGDRPLPMIPPGSRTILSALLVRAGQLVTVRDLTGYLWGDTPPGNPRAAVHTHVSRLRDVIDNGSAESLIQTREQGYRIELGDSRLDLVEFRALVTAADEATTASERLPLLERGLGLWRGEPLADVLAETLVEEVAPRLIEERMRALELLIDAQLRLGRHSESVTELTRLTVEYPLRERFWALRMVALAGSGQQAGALQVYAEIRARLADELGVDPGPDLRAAHQQVLRQEFSTEALLPSVEKFAADPAPARLRAETPVAVPVVPAELPRDVPAFTGRVEALAALDALLSADGATVVVSAIGGTGGVGKTALAVHWAHGARDQFPDGQLYVDLRGYGPDQPVSPANALSGFLRSLGVSTSDIPRDVGEQATRFRTLVNGKRILLVLDNAGTVDQVRPLLPGSPTCMVIVTSRDTLPGLVARDGARRLRLDLMPPTEGLDLLRSLLGARVDAEPDAAAALVVQCARLPLGLRLAAEIAAGKPTAPLSGLVKQLADEHQRLDRLDPGGDPGGSVRAVFSSSYRNLPDQASRVFRLLGLHPGQDVDAHAVAALTALDLDLAHQVLAILTRTTLVDESPTGRFHMHDLLRSYATELAHDLEPESERHAARTRLLDYYLHTTIHASNVIAPYEMHMRAQVAPSTVTQDFADEREAMSWLDAEWANLLAIVEVAAGGRWAKQAAQFSSALFRYLELRSNLDDGLKVHTLGLNSARRCGDRHLEVAALIGLGAAQSKLGEFQTSILTFERAGALARQIGDNVSEGRAAGNAGQVYEIVGRFDDALNAHGRALALAKNQGDLARQAVTNCSIGCVHVRLGNLNDGIRSLTASLELATDAGDLDQLAISHSNLGDVYGRLGRLDEALYHDELALTAAAHLGDIPVECNSLINLGSIHGRLGHYELAGKHLERARVLSREAGYALFEATALNGLGLLHRALGRHAESVELHSQALARCPGNPGVEAESLNGLGEALLASGDPISAAANHESALRIAEDCGERLEIARAHHGLGQIHRGQQQVDRSRRHYEQALMIFTALGVPQADEVRNSLLELTTPTTHVERS